MEEIEPEVKFQRQQWCVFYDRRTGDVLHIHEYVSRAGEKPLTNEKLIDQARKAAGHRTMGDHVRVLHPPEGTRLDPAALYAVDPRDGSLFKIPPTSTSERVSTVDRTRPDLR